MTALLLLFYSALEAPLFPEPPATEELPSAWQRVEAAYQSMLAESATAGPLVRPMQEFTAAELLEALKEGVMQARQQAEGPPPDHAVLRAISICASFYPFVARDESDAVSFLELLDAPAQDLVLRLYLLRRLVPGLEPRSAFGEYLEEAARRQFNDVTARLNRLVYQPAEPPEIQLAAMEALYLMHMAAVQTILRSEPALVEQYGEGKEIDPAVLREKGLRLSGRNQTRINQKQQDFLALARLFARHLAPESASTPALRDKAVELLEYLVAKAPLRDRNAVRALLPPKSADPA